MWKIPIRVEAFEKKNVHWPQVFLLNLIWMNKGWWEIWIFIFSKMFQYLHYIPFFTHTMCMYTCTFNSAYTYIYILLIFLRIVHFKSSLSVRVYLCIWLNTWNSHEYNVMVPNISLHPLSYHLAFNPFRHSTIVSYS